MLLEIDVFVMFDLGWPQKSSSQGQYEAPCEPNAHHLARLTKWRHTLCARRLTLRRRPYFQIIV